jgi:hypothetical protein
MKYRASYDVLALLHHLPSTMNGADEAELHVFVYLACLLSVYAGQSAADWGYDFIASPAGAPFAPDLEDALRWAANVGFVTSTNGRWQLSLGGSAEFAALSGLFSHQRRMVFIEPACASTLSIPLGWVRRGLDQTPALRSAARRDSRRYLSDEAAMDALYEQFGVLKRVVRDNVSDLLVPAVIWLEYLASATLEGTLPNAV